MKYTAKQIVLGNRNVGKTTMTKYLLNEPFQIGSSQATISLEIKRIQIQNLSLRIFDFPGSEELVIPNYFRNTQIALIMFSVTDEESFKSVQRWYSIFKEYNPLKSMVIIVKNKTDLYPTFDCSLQTIKQKLKHLECPIIETSLKTKQGLDTLKEIIMRTRQWLISDQEGFNVDLHKPRKNEQRGYCKC